MVENIQPPQPNWQDISFADINACILEGRIREALAFARIRLEGIRTMPPEIDAARPDIRVTNDKNWNEAKETFTAEIAQLENVIAQLESEL